jgi:alkylmercury lyase
LTFNPDRRFTVLAHPRRDTLAETDMTTTSSDQLVRNITSLTAQNPTAATLVRMTRPVIRRLAAGRPPTVDEIARASGVPAADVERTLRALPYVERDANGRVVSLMVTTRPTDHVIDLDGRTLYAWCALDTLIVAALLEHPVVIRSRDRRTGDAIRVELGADGLAVTEPSSAVMSWVGEIPPDNFGRMRATICHHVHFFASREAAARWSAEHPGGAVLSMPDAVEAARRLAAIFPDAARSERSGSPTALSWR